VIIVPGLPGTHLGRRGFPFDDVIWLDFAAIHAGRLSELAFDTSSAPLDVLDVLDVVYLQLILRLRVAGYHVVVHPFDWRRPLAELGLELSARIHAQPGEVHVVAHSFGGLVTRAAIAVGAPKLGKVIMLAVPNQGTFAAVQGFRGNHWLLRLISAIEPQRTPHQLAEGVFSTWPSVYEQLPTRSLFDEIDLYDPRTWPSSGPAPRPELLAAAKEAQAWIRGVAGQFLVIAGYGVATVDRVALEPGEPGGFRYFQTDGGDGWATSRSARLDGYPCWHVQSGHIGMPNHPLVLSAVEDLLARGETDRLLDAPPPPRELPPLSDFDRPADPFGGRRGHEISLADVHDALNQV
jgi:hypothetical protein